MDAFRKIGKTFVELIDAMQQKFDNMGNRLSNHRKAIKRIDIQTQANQGHLMYLQDLVEKQQKRVDDLEGFLDRPVNPKTLPSNTLFKYDNTFLFSKEDFLPLQKNQNVVEVYY